MSFLSNVFGFEKFHGGQILKDIGHKPTRLLTGVDPLSTKAWNGILGTDDKPIVDQMGGATQDRYLDAEAAGINPSDGKHMQGVAHVVAALMAGNYGAGKMGLTGGGGSSGGGGMEGATKCP